MVKNTMIENMNMFDEKWETFIGESEIGTTMFLTFDPQKYYDGPWLISRKEIEAEEDPNLQRLLFAATDTPDLKDVIIKYRLKSHELNRARELHRDWVLYQLASKRTLVEVYEHMQTFNTLTGEEEEIVDLTDPTTMDQSLANWHSVADVVIRLDTLNMRPSNVMLYWADADEAEEFNIDIFSNGRSFLLTNSDGEEPDTSNPNKNDYNIISFICPICNCRTDIRTNCRETWLAFTSARTVYLNSQANHFDFKVMLICDNCYGEQFICKRNRKICWTAKDLPELSEDEVLTINEEMGI